MNDIAEPQFTSSWGVSDEDLFIQADKELSYLAQQQQPFLVSFLLLVIMIPLIFQRIKSLSMRSVPMNMLSEIWR